jgi:hypothetical protein
VQANPELWPIYGIGLKQGRHSTSSITQQQQTFKLITAADNREVQSLMDRRDNRKSSLRVSPLLTMDRGTIRIGS